MQELWINIVFVETPWKRYFWTWTLTARSSNVNKMMLSVSFTHYISMVIQTKHIPCQTWNKGAPWTHPLNWLTHWQVGASSTKFPTTKSLTIILCTFVTRCEIFNPSLNTSCFAHHYTCIYKAYLPSLLHIAQCSVLQVINMNSGLKQVRFYSLSTFFLKHSLQPSCTCICKNSRKYTYKIATWYWSCTIYTPFSIVTEANQVISGLVPGMIVNCELHMYNIHD